MRGILGIFFIILVAWVLSENRRQIVWKKVVIGLLLQLVVAVLFLKVSFLQVGLLKLNILVQALESATASGSQFLFGFLAGGDAPFDIENEGANFIVAFRVLPLILIVSALSSVLFHFGVIQRVVRIFAKLLQKTLGINGPEGVGVAANIYLGIVEAPLFIKPYLRNMSRSSLFLVMSAGMATVAGTVMVLYASLLNPILPGALGHILVASVISAPAVILMAHLMVPQEKNLSEVSREDSMDVPIVTKSGLDALVKGTMEGMELLISVVAMILVLFSLVHLMNQGLSFLFSDPEMSLQKIIGYAFRPLLWMMGVGFSELPRAAELMGTKMALNEFISYSELARIPSRELGEKTRLILIYSMCGFANFASVGLILGAL